MIETRRIPPGNRMLKHYNEDLNRHGITLLTTQFLCGHPGLVVATEIDDIGVDLETGVFWLIERKQGYLGRNQVPKRGKLLKAPFTHLSNCQKNHHILQAVYGRLFMQTLFPELRFRSMVVYTNSGRYQGNFHFDWVVADLGSAFESEMLPAVRT